MFRIWNGKYIYDMLLQRQKKPHFNYLFLPLSRLKAKDVSSK